MNYVIKPLILTALLLLPGISFALDAGSIQCLGCHDASIATDVTLQVCSLPGCDHPIGIDYVSIASINHEFTPAQLLNPALILAGGNEVGCTTCHVPYSADNHDSLTQLRQQYPSIPDPMLNMDNRQSQICFACHLKD